MQQVQTERSANHIVFSNSLFKYELRLETAGFPSRIGFADGTELLREDKPILSVDVDGRTAFPSLKHGFDPDIIEDDGCTRVLFDDIRWEYEDGSSVPDYRLSLYYEVFADGVVFVRTFFFTDTLAPGTIGRFELKPGFALPKGCDANWAWWEYPDASSAKLIQSIKGFGRNLPQDQCERFDGKILPFVSFDFGRDGRRDMHCEFFVECFSPLAPDEIANTSTDILWENGNAHVAWNFQKNAIPVPGRAYQWRNTWGWSVTRFPVERKHPPLRLYHYIDNFDRYPSEEIIREAAAEGANLFMLHENWRLDLKQGEFPYDKKKLTETISNIHKHGMRTALYVRGNEDAVRQDYAEPLRPYLKKDWDGIYMDFGAPAFLLSKDEYASGGRIQFREYHKMVRKIREFVGEEGVFLAHSGSYFASMAHTQVDAYVSGEQEKGQLIKDRTLHAYYSGLSISPSALWTAAFSTYRTKAALPYLAATAQTPFVILGTQMQTSSLDHPKVPSTITFQRPLWRLWELLDGETDVKVYTKQSTEGIFDADDETGACLIVTRSGEALLIVANFSEERRDAELKVDWVALGISPKSSLIGLSANYESNSWREVDGELKASLNGYGVTGWLFVDDAGAWQNRLKRFARPYPSFPEREKECLELVERIRDARFNAPEWKECYLQVALPNTANTYEDSLIWDLYENKLQLQKVDAQGAAEVLGYIGNNGLISELDPDARWLVCGESSPWIPLHEILEAGGAHTLVLATKRGAGDFYNFFRACLSPVPGPSAESREIIYSNAIDMDWSLLSFIIRLQD